MAVYMRPARKTKLMRCMGNWKDKANTEPDFVNKGKQKHQRTRRILDGHQKTEE